MSVLWREVSNRTYWQQGPTANLSQDSDWIATVKIQNLLPETRYECKPRIYLEDVSLIGIIDILVDSNQTILPYPPRPIRFSTFPDPRLTGGRAFRFLVSSCVTPNFPYRGPLNRKAIHGFDLLARSLDLAPVSSLSNEIQPGHETPAEFELQPEDETQPRYARHSPVDFLLFLGDFIYADVPIYIGDKREAYRRLYRRNYQNIGFRSIYENIREFS